MKTLGILLLAFAFVRALPTNHKQMLDTKECTSASYWCSNLTTAADCNAVKHCIQTVWEHKKYPLDTDSICETCKSMVKQARDQLESNETMEEIKEVFDGSCKLIPIKTISQECCKLADDYIPELVDTLASQMNPDIVCAVAGLCNNARYDQLIAQYKKDEVATKHPPREKPDTCTGCNMVVGILEKRFNRMTSEEFLQNLLQLCGHAGSYSDACSNIIVTYFHDIYNRMKNEFNAKNICLLSGECSTNFHVHEITITPMSDVGVVPVNDDLPCELCEQLVQHLRELLIANTTESEFKRVLEGLCKQTGQFSHDCLSMVEEYYAVIYNYLVDELNGSEVCKLIQICPQPTNINKEITPIIPALPVKTVEKLHRVSLTKDDSAIKAHLNDQFEAQSLDAMQLPIERLHNSMNNVYSKNLCVFCEYFLHYVQQAITDPITEDNIRKVISNACDKLPRSVNDTCQQFVTTYSDAFVAILAQEIDPSIICPLLQVCPKLGVEPDIEIFMHTPGDDKPNCPMCLFAVTQLEEMVKRQKTKDNIKDALNNLCGHLAANLRGECQDFVNTYTDELVEMMMNDFKPQEVCVYLKLCKDDKPAPALNDLSVGGLISTNEIPDFTAYGVVINSVKKNKPQCVLCEFIMEKVEEVLKNKKTEEEIKEEIHSICNHMPKSVVQQCNDFVTKYGDLVIDMIIADSPPDQICQMLEMCEPTKPKPKPHLQLKSPLCTVCKLVMTQVESMIGKNFTEEDITKALETVCYVIPSNRDDCDEFMKEHSKQVYDLLVLATKPGEICSLLFLCDIADPNDVKGHVHACAVCENVVAMMNALLINPKLELDYDDLPHVFEKTCRALPLTEQSQCEELLSMQGKSMFTLLRNLHKPEVVCKKLEMCQLPQMLVKRQTLVGANKCTWGPGYWCSSEENADECGTRKHCEEKVWNGPTPKSRKKREQLLGANKCTWGPTYWCANEKNADECGTRPHCEEKVWLGSSPKA